MLPVVKNSTLGSKIRTFGSVVSRFFSGVSLTDSAAEKLKTVLDPKKNEFLRLEVKTGGCAGLSYNFKIDDKNLPGDIITCKNGSSLHVDEVSAPYVNGATIDFVSEPFRQYFTISDNPNATSRCSCGESFIVPGADVDPEPCS